MFGKTTTQGCVTKTYKKHNNISYPELPLSFAQIPIHSGHCPVQIWTDFRVYFGKQIKRDRRKTTTTTTTSRIEIDGPVHSASAYARIVYLHTFIYVYIFALFISRGFCRGSWFFLRFSILFSAPTNRLRCILFALLQHRCVWVRLFFANLCLVMHMERVVKFSNG